MSLSSRIASSEFQLANEASDYIACDELCKAEGLRRSMLTFPTVMVYEKIDRTLIGFLGTRIEKNMIIAGPLVMRSDRRRIFTALRLAEAYEAAMLNLGISSFIFHVEAGSLLDRAMKRYYGSMEPYAVKDGAAFYVWRIADGRRRISASSERGGESAPGRASGSA